MAGKEYHFYGWERADVPAENGDYRGIQTPCDLYDALSVIWCAETCAPRMRKEWTRENRTLGQCSITAFLAQDIFGGKVYGIPRPDGNYHCYNVVGDCVFDLTSEQFGREVLDYEGNPEQFREIHFAKEEKRQRYEYLKEKLGEYVCRPEGKIMSRTFPQEAQKIMNERFGHDTLIGLATIDDTVPDVRTVNAYYEDGAFYIVTYGLSNKMKQLEKNPNVGICGDWFTAHGKGINLGWFCKEENRGIADKLKSVFKEWIDNGHTDFEDKNTIILCVQLTDGILFSHGTRYDIDFTDRQD